MTPRPPASSVRPTRDGVAVLLFTGALAAVVWFRTGTLVELVLAVLVALWVVELVVGAWNLRGLSVVREAPVELFAGDVGRGAVVVASSSPWGAAGLEVVDPTAGLVAHVLRVPSRGRARAGATWRFGRRGKVVLGAVTVMSSFPFGLLTRTVTLPAPAEVWVWPAPVPGRVFELPVPDGATAGRDPGDELVELRAWRPGDRMRDVHARTSLRRGAPHVVVRGAVPLPARWLVVPELIGEPRERALANLAHAVITDTAAGRSVGLVVRGQQGPACSGRDGRARLLTQLAELP